MTGGLRGTVSLMAIAALSCVVGATVFVAKPAKAADLGGDCCADLEERVAELEATTARKGNKKVSVQIYGKVNYAVMFWDDGGEQNVYSVNNYNESSRTGFKGNAKISDDWSAGYRLEWEYRHGRLFAREPVRRRQCQRYAQTSSSAGRRCISPARPTAR